MGHREPPSDFISCNTAGGGGFIQNLSILDFGGHAVEEVACSRPPGAVAREPPGDEARHSRVAYTGTFSASLSQRLLFPAPSGPQLWCNAMPCHAIMPSWHCHAIMPSWHCHAIMALPCHAMRGSASHARILLVLSVFLLLFNVSHLTSAIGGHASLASAFETRSSVPHRLCANSCDYDVAAGDSPGRGGSSLPAVGARLEPGREDEVAA